MTFEPVINDPEATRHPNPGGPRPPERIDDVLDVLGDYWRAHPDLRLGQILHHIARPVDVRFIEDHFVLTRLREGLTGQPTQPRLRYVTRTAQRGARRIHVWREEPSALDPDTRFTSIALCGGVDDQVLPGLLPVTVAPLADPLTAAQVTCDRCWSVYERHLSTHQTVTDISRQIAQQIGRTA